MEGTDGVSRRRVAWIGRFCTHVAAVDYTYEQLTLILEMFGFVKTFLAAAV